MTDLDLEKLAALMEGRLGEAERKELLRLLDASPEARELLAESTLFWDAERDNDAGLSPGGRRVADAADREGGAPGLPGGRTAEPAAGRPGGGEDGATGLPVDSASSAAGATPAMRPEARAPDRTAAGQGGDHGADPGSAHAATGPVPDGAATVPEGDRREDVAAGPWGDRAGETATGRHRDRRAAGPPVDLGAGPTAPRSSAPRSSATRSSATRTTWHPPTRSRWRAGAAALAAAAVLVLVAVPLLRPDGPAGTPGADVREMLGRAGDPAGHPPGWTDPPWSVVRGGAGRLTEDETLFRLGVRQVDLSVALAGRDGVAAPRLAAEMRELAAGVALADPVVAGLAALQAALRDGGPGPGAAALAADVEAALDRLLDGSPSAVSLALGRWVGAARLAVAGGVEGFFAPGSWEDLLAAAVESTSDAAARTSLEALRQRLEQGVEVADLGTLGDALEGVSRTLGG